MKYLILSKIIIFPSTLFFVTYLYYLAIKKKKKELFWVTEIHFEKWDSLNSDRQCHFVSLSLWRATQEQWREESALLSVDWDRITAPSESGKNREQMPWSLWTNFDFESVYF